MGAGPGEIDADADDRWDEFKRKRAVTHLNQLDDHMLKDIGIGRCDRERSLFWAQAIRTFDVQ